MSYQYGDGLWSFKSWQGNETLDLSIIIASEDDNDFSDDKICLWKSW